MMKVVVIGGGTGTYTVLSGLKALGFDLTAIVTMMDSGGSNRIVRDEFGLLPTSDIRQCIVALADENQNDILRRLLPYRFHQGTGISGMTFANLFMIALTDLYGSQREAIEKTCELFNIAGKILPVTYDNVQLLAHYEDGKQVLGEHFIDEPETTHGKLVLLGLVPNAVANPAAIQAILDADLIVFGPGDLFTSLIANIIVEGIADALSETKAKIIYIVNLMTKFGQTDGFNALDHVNEISQYMGRFPDFVIAHNHLQVSPRIMDLYEREKATPVSIEALKGDFVVIASDIVSDLIHERARGDKLARSLIRHDQDKLSRVIAEIASFVQDSE